MRIYVGRAPFAAFGWHCEKSQNESQKHPGSQKVPGGSQRAYFEDFCERFRRASETVFLGGMHGGCRFCRVFGATLKGILMRIYVGRAPFAGFWEHRERHFDAYLRWSHPFCWVLGAPWKAFAGF